MRYLALIVSKISFWITRRTGTGGAALPGLVAKKLDSKILCHLTQNNFPDGIVVVTGTNGKTTTAKMIAGILDGAGISYVHNKTGSNLERGIISELISRSDLRGKIGQSMAILEIDEASLPIVLSQLKAKIVVVTNLFRDQLDRYGELQTTAKLITKGLRSQSTATIILNADDPLVASLGLEVSADSTLKYFGISSYQGPTLQHDYTADISYSPISNSPLIYSKKYFGHMGVYQSKNNDFRRPKPDYDVSQVLKCGIEGSAFRVTTELGSCEYSLEIPGLYNIYNALTALSIAKALGIDDNITTKSLKISGAAFGRFEKIAYKEREIVLLLIKNPTGFNQVIQTYLLDNKKTHLLLAINDNFADGRDVSWLWDSAIEDIASTNITVSGIRSFDMALRLKYADKKTAIVEDLQNALDTVVEKTKKGERIYVLPTYTAMISIRKLLVAQTQTKEYWQ